MTDDLKNHEYWRDKLSADEFHVCREQGTERAFTGEYWNHKDDGSYLCRCCGEALFESEAKYDSGCGWPSFTQPSERMAVEEQMDRSHGMVRTEVHCRKCGSHLGHVFTDGPAPNGLRYCINSLSIRFKEED
ncbi:peptide-methionine (R)-S-oxide reductase MsrB [Pseudoteredinibacter isoporae]|uniref:Peptide methionine sulfoxide reductase MsrB n=1 Tax=Pseudoteredinibacter isoporae TaxID=570281 RepID=A0A7X0JW35_9GAMM|nr:peptide-methionine (R)-S-oxide reductase MsrB [Pseudoteredinibacter isoporae]MBB6523282.1 peptide-methionine (R)-S-oxide reductase [Pseudoteredinibacter isoporae]NHO88796.1 peptide-methionine (R)-S-oxide reductase MsrB [Pseudoteredinibacter isoporae]NIB24496.1 peptide-methionine (R)-S-oxide reductase MsrB [Pseudoteredinibacter isoporae]